ncbi:hypothetical protein Cgig2_026600 [Carnegiea gigantea]|uniref:Uncharacterized protein n=1 Tax=Carnegiea gigantea TaxID=171969 RepID=A0A9Q1KKC1_9CARY|nr:hypothetical protein Cgig2_026600 [Carnegiea gigantea]
MEEKCLFQAFHSKKLMPKIRAKLTFDNPADIKKLPDSETNTSGNTSSMQIDDVVTLSTSGEVFKCKQVDANLPPGDDRKVRLIEEQLSPYATVTHVGFKMSDYLPILLKCALTVRHHASRNRRFMFKNIWLTDPSCRDVVLSVWESRTMPDIVENVLSKLDICSTKLSD